MLYQAYHTALNYQYLYLLLRIFRIPGFRFKTEVSVFVVKNLLENQQIIYMIYCKQSSKTMSGKIHGLGSCRGHVK